MQNLTIKCCINFLQAAIGSFALEMAMARNEGPVAEQLGREVRRLFFGVYYFSVGCDP